MYIKKITLNNIGPYQGKNIFDFKTTTDQNTILIGGKNGSGKTTFLNSVRLALYGPLAYGYKTTSNDYIKKINTLLNTSAIQQEQSNIKEYENEFYIQIDFSLIENFNRVHASITRRWEVDHLSTKEKVSVSKDGVEVSEVEKDQFFTHLRTSFPPSLLELCFFDGEEISHLTDEDNLSNYLRVLSSKIFNLDLFQNLEQDLGNYLNQSSKTNEQSNLENEREKLENELNNKINSLTELTSTIEEDEDELDTNKQRYQEVKKDFSLHGGIAYEERTNLQGKINEIEGTRKHLSEKIKEFIALELPFFIAYPTLLDLVHQLKNEEDFHVSNVLKDKIEKLPVHQIIEHLGISPNGKHESKLKDSLVHHLAQTEDVSIIHNASKTEAQQVYNLESNTTLDRLNEIFSYIEKDKELLRETQKLKKKLKDNEESPEFADMIESMESYNRKISELEEKISKEHEIKDSLQDEIDQLNNKYEKVKHQLYKIRKTKSSFEESHKIIQVSQKFQQQQLRNKLRDIEYFSSKMFKELIRKKDFIQHIAIEPKNFSLSILDSNNDNINKDILSAGEKELLALSIIWGTIKSSKKELPLILDTLLGRLDNEHKHSIVTKLLPRFGVQNIVLSTDSEIGPELYNSMSDTTANEYTLQYDSNNRRTNIEKHFFNLSTEKVES
ncbi:DNA sulfur modification protein DndD [Halobacillus salinus]|uniref:DNA sulfur modification protein DndD n=1 Tax=Halobacillus salinus TaxID=192814 RepID=UPI0009A670A0|nr:DNA sulfur modification protein DndD [Halobacillus salinus]